MFQMRAIAAASVCAALTLSPGPGIAQPVIDTVQLGDRIDRYFTTSEQNGVVPGAIIVSRGGERIYEAYYGLADRAAGRGFDENTIFDIGSLTKQFTAAAILILADRGAIALTDTLDRYFDNVPADKASITIDQLLSHSSGLSDDTGAFAGSDFDPFISEQQVMAMVLASPLTSQPGTRYEYTNAGYSVLAAIIEHVSGQDYETFLRQVLFEPAGMDNTGQRQLEWSEDTAARGYDYRRADPQRADLGHLFLNLWQNEPVTWHLLGNGGIHSTPADLERWHQALQQGRILSPSSLRLYQAPHSPRVAPASQGFTHYGYGWAVGTSPAGTPVLSHNGGNSIFFASIHRYVQEDILVIHMTNEASREIERMGYDVGRMIFDPAFEPAPIPPYALRLALDFAASHDVSDAPALIPFIEARTGRALEAAWVLNRVGFRLLAEGRHGWAVAVLRANTERFPGDGNLHDSLATAYQRAGDLDAAIAEFRRALELAPRDGTCFWCADSTNGLAELGALPE
ncbi:serine hydrolase [Maricaulis sp.]|uniref:serine hydrolase domain-containing protein n=1 Tax=Maricaulis sp. TaxID=1486257 RepID=UPI003A942BC9